MMVRRCTLLVVVVVPQRLASGRAVIRWHAQHKSRLKPHVQQRSQQSDKPFRFLPSDGTTEYGAICREVGLS